MDEWAETDALHGASKPSPLSNNHDTMLAHHLAQALHSAPSLDSGCEFQYAWSPSTSFRLGSFRGTNAEQSELQTLQAIRAAPPAFGVMHAIGARPKTVRRIVAAEGVFIAVASCPLAVIPALGRKAAMNAVLGNLFFYAPLPFPSSLRASGSCWSSSAPSLPPTQQRPAPHHSRAPRLPLTRQRPLEASK